MRIIALVLLLGAFALAPQRAIAAPCDRLSPNQKKLSQKLFRTTYPYDCCDEALDRCLKHFKVCKLAKRLRDDICRRVKKGQKEKQIQSALKRRARSMMPAATKASFDLSQSPLVGAKNAPVQVVAYACARCPFCAKVLPDLYRLVTRGGLKGKVQLHFRPFPIRSHPGSVEGGLAFVAATQLGKFWPFMLKLYEERKNFAPEKLPQWAQSIGMNAEEFKKKFKDKTSRTLLIKSKKEGLRNQVNATPTLFINGRKYDGDMDHDSLLDVLDEEHDRVGKRQFCTK